MTQGVWCLENPLRPGLEQMELVTGISAGDMQLVGGTTLHLDHLVPHAGPCLI